MSAVKLHLSYLAGVSVAILIDAMPPAHSRRTFCYNNNNNNNLLTASGFSPVGSGFLHTSLGLPIKHFCHYTFSSLITPNTTLRNSGIPQNPVRNTLHMVR
jgi:hypothetical protein